LHFLPTSRMCVCETFPVYSSKQRNAAKLPPELDNLCLACVLQICFTLGECALDALRDWLPGAGKEVDTFYTDLYANVRGSRSMTACRQRRSRP
jgi:hypothetical protein